MHALQIIPSGVNKDFEQRSFVEGDMTQERGSTVMLMAPDGNGGGTAKGWTWDPEESKTWRNLTRRGKTKDIANPTTRWGKPR